MSTATNDGRGTAAPALLREPPQRSRHSQQQSATHRRAAAIALASLALSCAPHPADRSTLAEARALRSTSPPPSASPQGATEPELTSPASAAPRATATQADPSEPSRPPAHDEPSDHAQRADTEAGGDSCVRATRIWREDFETGDYRRWTGRRYGAGWGAPSARCRDTGFSTRRAHGGRRSHRSAITCESHTDVHRGYGGIQLSGEQVLESFTNSGEGLQAPHGAVTTFWRWLDVPYDFGDGRWLSLWTVNTDCGHGEEVVTLGLDSAERRLTPAHVSERYFERDAPTFPLRRWVRVTVYVDAEGGHLHVWQDGQSVAHARFERPSSDLCQWHWGAYASGDNDQLTLFEDDQSLWRLDEAWRDFAREPWLGHAVQVCDPAPVSESRTP